MGHMTHKIERYVGIACHVSPLLISGDDGTVHNGPHHGWSLFGRATGAPSGIAFGHGFVQIGKWRAARSTPLGLRFLGRGRDGSKQLLFCFVN